MFSCLKKSIFVCLHLLIRLYISFNVEEDYTYLHFLPLNYTYVVVAIFMYIKAQKLRRQLPELFLYTHTKKGDKKTFIDKKSKSVDVS